MAFKLYRLTATVSNEKYDGRKKYGIGSIPEFKVGAIYSMQESAAVPGEATFRHPACLQYGDTSANISRELEILLLSVSVDVPLTRWSHVQSVVYPGGDDWLAAAVLEAIIARGMVDITTVHQFADNIYNQDQA